VAQRGVAGVDQVEVGALPVPYLPPRIARVGQDRRDRPQRPRCPGAVRVPFRVGGGRARDPGIVQGAGDPGYAVPGQPLGEYPLDDRCRGRVRSEAVRPPAPCGVGFVRMRSRIGEPVPVWRTAA
jgi:hypothetical protein